MADNEIVKPIEDVELNIGVTSQNLVDLDSGSDERVKEANIYEMQHRIRMDMEKNEYERIIEEKKLALEERRLYLDESKEKREKISIWVNVGLVITELTAFVGTGILTLKYNMEQGGLLGKDGQKWFDAIRHLRNKKF